MKKVIIIGISAVLVAIVVQQQDIAVALLGLLVAGRVPGTSFVVPFWAMIAVYCITITVLVTHYIEGALAFRRDAKALSASKSRMPRRRYSHV